MALLFKDMFDVQKVTINSNKNGAGGYTLFTPKSQYSEYPTKRFLLANMMIAMGGRAAEVVLYNNTESSNLMYKSSELFVNFDNLDVTTGASNDLKQVNSIARQYVSLFGLGKNVGVYDSLGDNSQPFLGRTMGTNEDKMSDYSKEIIDKEISELIEYAYSNCLKIIHSNNYVFREIATLLLDKKTIGFDELNKLTVKYM
jgi:cell division protease FtsH